LPRATSGKVGSCIPQSRCLGLQTFLQEKFSLWAANGSCVEEIWKSYKEIVFESTEHFVPHKMLRKTLDPEYYNREVKRLKLKRRRAYNMRKLEEYHQAGLSKQLLAAILMAGSIGKANTLNCCYAFV
jgi:hypothetical protein